MKIEIGGLVMPRVKSGFLLEFKAVKDAIERLGTRKQVVLTLK